MTTTSKRAWQPVACILAAAALILAPGRTLAQAPAGGAPPSPPAQAPGSVSPQAPGSVSPQAPGSVSPQAPGPVSPSAGAPPPWVAVPGGQAATGQAVYPHPDIAQAVYRDRKRSHGIATLVEWLFPGLGSIYSDHGRGALITWGLLLAGGALLTLGLHLSESDLEPGRSMRHKAAGSALIAGLGLVLASRVHGFVDAWRSTTRYNDDLRLRLGLPEHLSSRRHPLTARRPLVLGPRLYFTF
jgi:hypothetical protein